MPDCIWSCLQTLWVQVSLPPSQPSFLRPFNLIYPCLQFPVLTPDSSRLTVESCMFPDSSFPIEAEFGSVYLIHNFSWCFSLLHFKFCCILGVWLQPRTVILKHMHPRVLKQRGPAFLLSQAGNTLHFELERWNGDRQARLKGRPGPRPLEQSCFRHKKTSEAQSRAVSSYILIGCF